MIILTNILEGSIFSIISFWLKIWMILSKHTKEISSLFSDRKHNFLVSHPRNKLQNIFKRTIANTFSTRLRHKFIIFISYRHRTIIKVDSQVSLLMVTYQGTTIKSTSNQEHFTTLINGTASLLLKTTNWRQFLGNHLAKTIIKNNQLMHRKYHHYHKLLFSHKYSWRYLFNLKSSAF